MSITLCKAALCGSLALFAIPANAASDTAPYNPELLAPKAVTRYVSYCEAGTAPVSRDGTVYCNGVPSGRFVQAEAVPAGYGRRVIVINEDKAGYQDFNW